MNVLYDISWLGYSHANKACATGLGRFIKSLGLHLAASPECRITLCSADSFGAVAGSLDLLRTDRQFQNVPFTYARVDAHYQIAAHRIASRIDQRTNQNYFTRGLRRILRDTSAWAAKRRGPLPAESIARADIFHSPFLPLPESTRRKARLARFLTINDLIPLYFPELCHDAAPKMLQRILTSITPEDHVQCISHRTKADLCEELSWLDPARVIVTYLGASAAFYPVKDPVSLAAVRRKYGIPEGPYVLTLSALEPRKGMGHTIECFGRLVEEAPGFDCNLVVAGGKGWKFEGIVERAAKLPSVGKRVILPGRIDDADLAALYSGSLMFVFPSLYEGFGLPVLEAMQCGTPVVTSNTSSLPEVVGDAAILVAPRDQDALCGAILEIQQKTALQEELRRKALARARAFSWERCRDETLGAYRVALAEKRSATNG